MILTCVCRSRFQDALYGSHKRVHTPANKSAVKVKKGQPVTPLSFRCTVCGSEHSPREDRREAPKAEENTKKGKRAKKGKGAKH